MPRGDKAAKKAATEAVAAAAASAKQQQQEQQDDDAFEREQRELRALVDPFDRFKEKKSKKRSSDNDDAGKKKKNNNAAPQQPQRAPEFISQETQTVWHDIDHSMKAAPFQPTLFVRAVGRIASQVSNPQLRRGGVMRPAPSALLHASVDDHSGRLVGVVNQSGCGSYEALGFDSEEDDLGEMRQQLDQQQQQHEQQPLPNISSRTTRIITAHPAPHLSPLLAINIVLRQLGARCVATNADFARSCRYAQRHHHPERAVEPSLLVAVRHLFTDILSQRTAVQSGFEFVVTAIASRDHMTVNSFFGTGSKALFLFDKQVPRMAACVGAASRVTQGTPQGGSVVALVPLCDPTPFVLQKRHIEIPLGECMAFEVSKRACGAQQRAARRRNREDDGDNREVDNGATVKQERASSSSDNNGADSDDEDAEGNNFGNARDTSQAIASELPRSFNIQQRLRHDTPDSWQLRIIEDTRTRRHLRANVQLARVATQQQTQQQAQQHQRTQTQTQHQSLQQQQQMSLQQSHHEEVEW